MRPSSYFVVKKKQSCNNIESLASDGTSASTRGWSWEQRSGAGAGPGTRLLCGHPPSHGNVHSVGGCVSVLRLSAICSHLPTFEKKRVNNSHTGCLVTGRKLLAVTPADVSWAPRRGRCCMEGFPHCVGSFHPNSPESGAPALDFAEEEAKVQQAEFQVDRAELGSQCSFPTPNPKLVPTARHTPHTAFRTDTTREWRNHSRTSQGFPQLQTNRVDIGETQAYRYRRSYGYRYRHRRRCRHRHR